MAIQNTDETKRRILALIQQKGPSLPVQLSREIKISTLFISAFLSELKDEKRIKISNLKVGGSPLYFIEGQETQLENFRQYLHQKEVEAFELLKKSKILRDSEQEPVIRVALRSIKDFAFSFKKDDELYWRYLNVSEQEVKDVLEPSSTSKESAEVKIEVKTEEKNGSEQEPKKEPGPETMQKPEKPARQKRIPKTKQEILPVFENPLALKPEPPKLEKIKPKSDFVLKTMKFLEKNDFKILEEKEYRAKEYNCICQLRTELGPIDFLTQAKDKKTISDQDLDSLLRQAQSIPLPALMIYPENLNKKAVEYSQKYYSVLKIKKLS